MSSACKSAEARPPVRATYVNLYKWPESDAEFVKSIAGKRSSSGSGYGNNYHVNNYVDCRRRKFGPSTNVVVDSYSCRQMYLRSYKFSKKESVPEKTMRCIAQVKEKAMVLPFLSPRNEKGGAAVRDESANSKRKRSEMKKKISKKGCSANLRKLGVASCKVARSILFRLLTCAASVDVADPTRV
ncbi:uncharacterized protein LOC109709438 [Ananas comosus]|uniref:Uncharacterized protein LOC109709438 n=1 Tax=Ananas comosus TaxID=4615 RepID=A0A6P5F1A5_ANACO|nr:uncharacterized protein LOC109709438 [Ananas comosus]